MNLSEVVKEEQTKLFKETGTFFAFSNAQVVEGVAKVGGFIEDFVSLGAGIYCLKEHSEKLEKGLEKINKEGIVKHVELLGTKGVIKEAFYNHETAYTMDETDALEQLEDYLKAGLINIEEVAEVFKECYLEDDNLIE